MSNTSKMLAAIAAGAAAGAIVGILFAPDKGSETRRKIHDKSGELADRVKSTFRRGKEKMNGLKEEAEDALMQKDGAFV